MRQVFPRRPVRSGFVASLWLVGLVALTGCEAPVEAEHYGIARFFDQVSEVQSEVYFKRDTATLARGEATRIQRLLGIHLLSRDDDVIVTLVGSGSEILDARRDARLRQMLAATPARITIRAPAGFTLPARQSEVAFIQVKRYGSVRVSCPDIDRSFSDPSFGSNRSPINCANKINIAEMAVDRRDLTAPGSYDGSDAHRAQKSIKDYRSGENVRIVVKDRFSK